MINHLSLKLFIIVGIRQVFKFEFLKFRIMEIFELSPMISTSILCLLADVIQAIITMETRIMVALVTVSIGTIFCVIVTT